MEQLLQVPPRLRVVDRPVDPRSEFRSPLQPLPPEEVPLVELVARRAVLASLDEVVKERGHVLWLRPPWCVEHRTLWPL